MPRSDQDFVTENSPFAAALIKRHPDWLAELASARRLDEDKPAEKACLASDIGQRGLATGLRRFRNREMLRIVWRELLRTASLEQTFSDLSVLAELCLEASLAHHEQVLRERFGAPRNEAGEPCTLAVVGMGKLGGRELNLSSDIDLVFALTESGHCDGRHQLSNEQFFTRLVRAAIRDLSEVTEEGFCFRVDARLRPFGESGPLVCSFGAMEQYYQREGRDWERYALVKARPVAGDLDAGHRLIRNLSPFVYRRYIDFGAVEALHDMHGTLREDTRRRDRDDDIKRGPGGIREIEFLVQTFQLLRGGRILELQTPSLFEALAALRHAELLSASECAVIEGDYRLLRQVENAIQALHDQQQHRLPRGEDRQRVKAIMARAGVPSLDERLRQTRSRVRQSFEACFPRVETTAGTTEASWTADLAEGSGLARFREALDRRSPSARARQRLDRLMPGLLDRMEAAALSEDVRGDVFRLLLAISRRSAYLSLLAQNPQALDRMLELFARSGWIAGTVIRHPALLDELIDPALGQQLPEPAEISATVQRVLRRNADTEARLLALNDTRQSVMLRIAVAEIEAAISARRAQHMLSALAETMMAATLELARAAVVERHGTLPHEALLVVGLGSLGARELSYDSDLDLIFLYEPCEGQSSGERALEPESWYTALVRRLLGYLTAATPSGKLYEVDTRLRPNGRAGLLVSSLPAFETYQRKRAWTWELQALTRARACLGPDAAAKAFSRIRSSVLSQARDPEEIREQVAAMRARMRKAHPDSDPLKHGPGGLIDIDFVAQLGVLLNAREHPACLEPTDTQGQLKAMHVAGWLNTDQWQDLSTAAGVLANARHRRLLSGKRQEASAPETGCANLCARILGAGRKQEARSDGPAPGHDSTARSG